MTSRRWGFVAVVLLALPVLPTMSRAADAPDRCAALTTRSFPGFTVEAATTVPAKDGIPAYCRITGTADPRIGFHARFPLTAWNGKFYQAGCGGFCGDFDPDKAGYSNTIGEAVKRGYAAIVSNNGHTGYLGDASWASDEVALSVYAETGIPKLHDVGHALVQALYGKAPRHSYFAGCSNGGRMAAMAAQRYPGLYDGILAGAPVLNLTLNGGLYGTWIVQKNTAADGSFVLGPAFNAKIPALRAEVLKQCTAVTDPRHVVVTDPRACKFNAEQLPHCAAGQNKDDCFTDAERTTIAALYAGPHNSAGKKLYPGTPLGSEFVWPVWLSGTAKSRAVGMDLGRDYMKMALSPHDPLPALQPAAFNFDRDPPRLAARAGAFDATDTDLSAFAKRGGKLLMYQGWADPVVLPERTVTYYEDAVAANGGLAKTQNFFRLFMIAGAGHCWELPADAPDRFDPIAALEGWVEHATAPTAIPIVQQAKDGTVIRRAALRPYPALEAFDTAP